MSDISLTEIIKKDIVKDILSKKYPEGAKIPTEAQLCKQYGVSRITAQNAIRSLVSEGYVHRMPGKGTFVTKKVNYLFLTKNTTFEEQIRQMGMEPSVTLLRREIIPADAFIAKQLQIPEKSKVVHVLRLRNADNEPYSYVDCHLPYDLCAHLMDADLENMSLYIAVNKNPQAHIARITRIVEAVAATKTETLLLGVPEGAPIHLFTSYAIGHDGRIIDYGVTHSRADRSKFAVELVPNLDDDSK